MVTIIGLMIAISSAGQTNPRPDREHSTIPFQTGTRFHQELDKTIAAAWVNVEFRSLLYELAAQRRVAVILDRRIDPTVETPVDLVDCSLKEAFREIAAKAAADASVTENVVYIGPAQAAGRLRTLIELRTAELQSKTNPIRESRRMELARRQTFSWEDLESPAAILKQIADRCHLSVQNSERIPHDLWARCSLPNVTAAEALSLVLIQFDLTFSWIEDGQGIDLAPIPDRVVVERRPKAKGRTPADLLKLIKEHFPGLEARLDGADLVVLGTLEEQEAVMALQNPQLPKKVKNQGEVPLRQQVFSKVELAQVPVREIMKEMEKSKVVFVYDAAKLSVAGIDLDQKVDVRLEKATGEEFLKAVFTPLKLSIEIDNMTVKLTPKN